MKLRSKYREIYYWMCEHFRGGKTNRPYFALSAVVAFMLLQVVNFGSILAILNNYYNIVIINQNNAPITGGIITFILSVINHNALYKRRLEIFEEFKNLSSESKKRGKLIFTIYSLGSILLYLIVLAFFVERH